MYITLLILWILLSSFKDPRVCFVKHLSALRLIWSSWGLFFHFAGACIDLSLWLWMCESTFKVSPELSMWFAISLQSARWNSQIFQPWVSPGNFQLLFYHTICFLPGLIQFYHIYFQIIFHPNIQVNPFVDCQSSLSMYLPPLWYSFPQISVAFATCIPSLNLL